ncbi:MAG: hypothetical protein AUH71_05330 [Thaumarchaeota archaeon 13_1_40CM_4_48_7]|nr:MAG: hypothetical protein AUH71_05330 [Thaumarchaeota archaeon 13_1_40CM_4_48_7]
MDTRKHMFIFILVDNSLVTKMLASTSTRVALVLIILGTLIVSLVFPIAIAQTEGGGANLKTFKASYRGQSFDVKAVIPNNGTIDVIEVYPEYGSIYITLTMGSGGQQDAYMKIILPRNLIDSKANGTDSRYVVVVDSKPTTYEETRTTSSDRELTFSIPTDASDIEIFGRQVVPEFPGAVVAAIAMSVVIVVTVAMGRIRTNNANRL